VIKEQIKGDDLLIKVFKVGDEAVKIGCWPMRWKLGEKSGVVFSFAVVVTATESTMAPVASLQQ